MLSPFGRVLKVGGLVMQLSYTPCKACKDVHVFLLHPVVKNVVGDWDAVMFVGLVVLCVCLDIYMM